MKVNKKGIQKKLVITIVIMAVNTLLPSHGMAQDTLFFNYDFAAQQLSIKMIEGSTATPCFKINQNRFSKKLDSFYNNETGLPSDNPQYRLMYQKLPTTLYFDSNYFDSAQCAELDVRIYSVQEKDALGNYCPVKVMVVHKTPEVANSSVRDSNTSGNIGLWVCMVVVVAAAVFVMVLLKKRKREPRKPAPSTKSKDNSLEVVEVVSESLINGLDAVRQDAKSYYLMDMQKDFDDTAVKKMYLHHTAVKKMYDFFKKALESSDQTTETGCYFVGCWEYADKENQTYNISVEDIVEPGDDIVSEEFSFNFGLKIGVKLFAKISELTKRTNRDFVHTVWMHSHPGLGLFLSSHDLQVQQQLSYTDHPKRLVAFVIDTNTPEWDLAVFTAQNDGTMNNKEDLKHLYSLEELYRWSRDTHSAAGNAHGVVTETVSEQKSMDDYYAVQVNHQGSTKTLNAYFSGRAINAIDDILYDHVGESTIGGYVVGSCEANGNIGIDDCLREPVPNALGLFVVDAKVTDQSIASIYVKEKPMLCVLVCRSDDELLMLTRSNTQESFPALADAAVCSMKPMKEWLRRRRIYK